jgi:hypothetical protein
MRLVFASIMALLMGISLLAVTFSDNFNRSDGAIGANWSTISTMSEMVISSNTVTNNNPGSAFSGSFYSAGSFSGSDQYSEAVIAVVSTDAFNGSGVAIRASGAASGYLAMTSSHASHGVRLQRAGTGWVDIDTAEPRPANGDVLRLEVSGSTVLVKLNGTTRITYNDGTPLTGGAPGVFSFLYGSMDDWSGGDSSGGDPPGAKPLCLRSLLGVGRC